MKRASMTVLTVALLVGLSSMTTSTSAQQAATDQDLVVTKEVSLAEQNATMSFWTHAAIASAQPLEMVSETGPAHVDNTAAPDVNPSDAPVVVRAGMAAPNADQQAQAAYPSDWAAMRASAQRTTVAADEPDGSSQVFTSYVVNQALELQLMYPHRWMGRLSFSTPLGTSYCSGTSISGNVMLTAAHCLYDSTNNRWYSNWAFTPAYRDSAAPFGTFVATQCWVLSAWVNLSGSYSINSWTRHDVGVCKMGTNSVGTTLNDAVGWAGRQWNFPYIRHLHNFGYPFRDYNQALLPDAGVYLRTCVAETFIQTTETRGMGCNLGGGISGGPWMANYAPAVVGGSVDGVNSGHFIGTQNIYAARFNSNNIVPLCTAALC